MVAACRDEEENMTTATQVNEITVRGREWFDKVNGNSYCSARVYVTDTAGNTDTIYVPFGYGYGDYYLQAAQEALHAAGVLELVKFPNGAHDPLWRVCQEQGIVLDAQIERGMTRRMVDSWGESSYGKDDDE